MSTRNLQEEAAKIIEQLPSSVSVEEEEILEQIRTLVEEYQVPLDEARRSVKNDIARDAGIDDLHTKEQTKKVEAITQPDHWVDITVKVVELWEPRSDAVGQVGLVGDETGQIKFTKWDKSDLESLSEGTVYEFENVVTDEYEGRLSVQLNSSTKITKLDKDIEVSEDTTEFTGALVDIQSGSGLIKRCPHESCTRVLQNGRCSDHGEVDGEFDLRIKGIFDDGETVQDVLFDREATEAVTNITLEEAKELAKDALDFEVVLNEIEEKIVGQYYRVSGPAMSRYILVNEFERLGETPDTESILIRARSI